MKFEIWEDGKIIRERTANEEQVPVALQALQQGMRFRRNGYDRTMSLSIWF